VTPQRRGIKVTSKKTKRIIHASMRGVKSKDAPYESATSQAAKNMTAGRKIKRPKKIPKPEIIYLSKETKKPLKRVRKGQEVYYALKKQDGVVHILHAEPQAKNVKLKKYLAKHIGDAKGDFTLFTQRRRTVAKKGEVKMKKGWKVVGGVISRWSKEKSVYVRVKRTRLAIPTVKSKQQAILYRSGQKRKALRPGYYKRGRHEISQLLSPVVIPLGKMVTLNLKGKTIHDSIRGLHVDTSLKKLKPWESVYYQFVVIYRDGKEIKTVPGSGASHPPGLSIEHGAFSGSISRLAALTQILSTNIRQAFTAQNLRFTELGWLNDVIDTETLEYQTLEKEGKEEEAGFVLSRLQKLTHADYHSRLPGRGPQTTGLKSVFPEDENGKRLRPPYPDMVRVKVMFEIHSDPQAKVKWEIEHKKGKKK
jgi:hypothetical protein